MKAEIINRQEVDMSPEAIDERLRMVEALRKLCVSLREAGARGPLADSPVNAGCSHEAVGMK